MTEEITGDTEKENSGKDSPKLWFWLISIIALLWFLMDMSAFVMRVFMLDEMIKNMPEDQQQLYLNMPLWVNVVFSAEVFGGLLGSICLLIRRKWALPLFTLSILGVLSQTFHVYFLSDAVQVMGMPAILMPLVAIVIGAVMLFVTSLAVSKNWIG